MMKINRLRFSGFGQWINQEFKFHDGINLIEAPNESGKSTLMQGLFALLYGRNKEGHYKTKQKATWFEQFMPWNEKNLYGGEIDYTIGKDAYRLVRSFHEDDQQLVKCKTGEVITETFPMDQKKERLFLESQIGLSGEMIQRICFLHSLTWLEKNKDKDAKEDELLYRLTSMMQQGEEMDVHPALHQLGQQIRATQAPEQRLTQEISALRKRVDQLKVIQSRITEDETRLHELSVQTQEMEQTLQHLQQQKRLLQLVRDWEYYQIQKSIWDDKLDRLVSLRAKERELKRKYEQIQLPANVEQQDLESYQQMLQKREHLLHQLRDIESQYETSHKQVQKFKEEQYLFIQFDFVQAQQMVQLLDQYKELESKINDRTGQTAKHQVQFIQAEEDIQQLKTLSYSPPALQKYTKLWKWLGVLSGLGSIGFFLFDPLLSATSGLISVGSFASFTLLKKRFERKLIAKEQAILKRWDVQSVFELYRKQETIAAALKQEETSEEEQMEQIRHRVKQWLSTYQDHLVPFDPSEWKQMLLAYIQKAKEKKKWIQNRENRLDYLIEDQDKRKEQLNGLEQEIEKSRLIWGTDRLTELNPWRNQFVVKQTIQEQLKAVQTELQQEDEQNNIQDWKEKQAVVQQKIDDLLNRAQGANSLLTEQASESDRLEEIRAKELACLKQKKQTAVIRGSLEVRYAQLDELADIEAQQKKLEAQKQKLQEERAALQLAVDMIQEARKQVEEDMAPQLKPHISKWIQQITQGRYQECNLLPNQGFHLSFFEPKTGKSIPVSALSRGTIDQMYFALRLAMVQFYSSQTKWKMNLPLFLDDSFVQFDDQRLAEALRILQYFGQQHQIFLCTCQSRERNQLEALGIPFRHVNLAELNTQVESVS